MEPRPPLVELRFVQRPEGSDEAALLEAETLDRAALVSDASATVEASTLSTVSEREATCWRSRRARPVRSVPP